MKLKLISLAILSILSYGFFWGSLANQGITNATIYQLLSPIPMVGHTIGASAVMIGAILAPGVVALVVWLGLFGFVKLCRCAYNRGLAE
jgi:hypothetical protein